MRQFAIEVRDLMVEKEGDKYDIYVYTKYPYALPLYKGTDIEKAKQTINRYCDRHIKNIESLRKVCLNRLERLE